MGQRKQAVMSQRQAIEGKIFPHFTPTHKVPWTPPQLGFGKMWWEETNLEYCQISQMQIIQKLFAYKIHRNMFQVPGDLPVKLYYCMQMCRVMYMYM